MDSSTMMIHISDLSTPSLLVIGPIYLAMAWRIWGYLGINGCHLNHNKQSKVTNQKLI